MLLTDTELLALVEKGQRIKLCLGVPAAWYSGLVFGRSSEGNFCIGFDDGDLKQYTLPFVWWQGAWNPLAALMAVLLDPREVGNSDAVVSRWSS